MARALSRRAWTQQELEILRHLYPRHPERAIKALAPHTPGAVRQQACKLGISDSRRGWSPQECSILRREWGDVGKRTLLSKLKGRTWSAVLNKSFELGLRDQQQGRVSITEAARRAGFCLPTLRTILEAQGVKVRRVWGQRTRQDSAPRQVVVWDDVRRAVERHLEAERERGERKAWSEHVTAGPVEATAARRAA